MLIFSPPDEPAAKNLPQELLTGFIWQMRRLTGRIYPPAEKNAVKRLLRGQKKRNRITLFLELKLWVNKQPAGSRITCRLFKERYDTFKGAGIDNIILLLEAEDLLFYQNSQFSKTELLYKLFLRTVLVKIINLLLGFLYYFYYLYYYYQIWWFLIRSKG